MNTCILQPPSAHNLSDDIVLSVRQRSQSFRTAYVTQDEAPNLINNFSKRYFLPEAMDAHSSSEDRLIKRRKSNDFSSSKHKLFKLSCGDLLPFKSDYWLKEGEEQKAVITEWVQSHDKYRREIRRLRQIRYRKKKDYIASLELENSKLEKEVEKLQQRQHAFLADSVACEKNPWNVIAEYFRLFRFGFQDPASSQRRIKGIHPAAQLIFLQATMAHDVLSHAGRGVKSIIQNWKYFTLWFQDVDLELHKLAKNGLNSFVASITTSFTITELSLRQVFPSLLNDEGSKKVLLGQKLLGQRIVMRGSTRFEWNDSNDQVTSIISESDMLIPMLSIIGCLEDVSLVFEGSLISVTSVLHTTSPIVDNI